MIPVYVLLAAPLVRPRRIPLAALVHALEGVADAACRRAARDGDRQRRPRVRSRSSRRRCAAIGHGIDVNEFACTDRARTRGSAALVLGRYSPAKGLETILRGVQQVDGVEVEAARRGAERPGATAPCELERLGFPLGDAVPRARGVRAASPARTCSINNMEAGAPDKVVYEAAARVSAGARVESRLRRALRRLSALSFDRESPESLAETAALACGARRGRAREDRPHAARACRASVTRWSTWADGILAAAR